MRWAGVLGLSLLAGLVVSMAIGVAAAQMDDRNFGEPRAEATAADRKIFADGLKQFSRAWDAHDGVGMRFNEHSCLGCHSVPKPGGRSEERRVGKECRGGWGTER